MCILVKWDKQDYYTLYKCAIITNIFAEQSLNITTKPASSTRLEAGLLWTFWSPRCIDGNPWREVCVDLIGPWTVQVHGRVYEFDALTTIDPVTNLTEIIQVQEKTSEHISHRFFLSWVARYIHDPSGAYMTMEESFWAGSFNSCWRIWESRVCQPQVVTLKRMPLWSECTRRQGTFFGHSCILTLQGLSHKLAFWSMRPWLEHRWRCDALFLLPCKLLLALWPSVGTCSSMCLMSLTGN